jgi:Family of unknown function (DUF6152)
MTKSLAVLALGFGSLATAVPALAHHSFAAEFDDKAPVTLKGQVTKIEWLNPHIWMYVDVKDASGKTANWALEGGPPNTLFRQGWRKDSLKPGDIVTVEGWRAKDGSSIANMRTVTNAEGKKMFAGSSNESSPGER